MPGWPESLALSIQSAFKVTFGGVCLPEKYSSGPFKLVHSRVPAHKIFWWPLQGHKPMGTCLKNIVMGPHKAFGRHPIFWWSLQGYAPSIIFCTGLYKMLWVSIYKISCWSLQNIVVVLTSLWLPTPAYNILYWALQNVVSEHLQNIVLASTKFYTGLYKML